MIISDHCMEKAKRLIDLWPAEYNAKSISNVRLPCLASHPCGKIREYPTTNQQACVHVRKAQDGTS